MAGSASDASAYVLGRGEGPAVTFLGHAVSFKASAASSGTMSVLEIEQRREGEPPMHVHHREDEAFYILEGQMTFYVGDDRLVAPAGAFVFLPRDIPHSFTVDGSGIARVLQICSPAGFEQFFAEWGEKPLDVPQMAAALAAYDVEIVGPPPRAAG